MDALGAHQKQAVHKNQWQHYLHHVTLGYQFMTYFPMLHFRRGNAREVINDRSIIIIILGSCNTRTLQTQLIWTSKAFHMFWFLKNKQQVSSQLLPFLFVCFWMRILNLERVATLKINNKITNWEGKKLAFAYKNFTNSFLSLWRKLNMDQAAEVSSFHFPFPQHEQNLPRGPSRMSTI